MKSFSALAKAEAAWGEELPSWLRSLALAIDAEGASLRQVARNVGVSGATLSYALGRTYNASYDRLKARVLATLKPAPAEAPAPGRKVAALTRAQAGWGDMLPDWIAALARACDVSSQGKVAKQLGFSVTVISMVLARRYGGAYGRVEGRVRTFLMQTEVTCPSARAVIPIADCNAAQLWPLWTTNPMMRQTWISCGRCPHGELLRSRQEKGRD